MLSDGYSHGTSGCMLNVHYGLLLPTAHMAK